MSNVTNRWDSRVFHFSARLGRGAYCVFGLAVALSGVAARAQIFSASLNLSNNAGLSQDPQIAVDTNDNINVVWSDDTPGNADIFFRRSTDGGVTFSAPKNISNNAGGSFFPQIAIDLNGNINVVWHDSTPGNFDIFFSRSTDGGNTFSAPKNISNNPSDSRFPQIAVDSNGKINVVWPDGDQVFGPRDLFFSRSSDGGSTFSPAKALSTLRQVRTPKIAVDSNGNIIVVWQDTDITTGNIEVFYSVSSDGGNSFTLQNISNNVGSSKDPHVAVNPAGNIVVVWSDNGQGNFNILFSRADSATGAFSAPKNVFVQVVDTIFPQIVADTFGNFNVVWNTAPGLLVPGDVFFSRSTDGGKTWSPGFNVSNAGTIDQLPQIAVARSCAIDIVWEKINVALPPFTHDIWFRSSTDGGNTFSSSRNLSNDAGNSAFAQIVVDSKGKINVVWDDDTPGNVEIFFARGVNVFPFDAISAKLTITSGVPPSFDLSGTFTLRNCSDGIFPPTEPLTLQVGAYSTTIPTGSFVQTKKGWFTFDGIINGVTLSVRIIPVGATSFQIQVDAQGADLTAEVNPVNVFLTIGNDLGGTQVNAVFQ